MPGEVTPGLGLPEVTFDPHVVIAILCMTLALVVLLGLFAVMSTEGLDKDGRDS